jgi:hypothetical protein
MGGATGGFRTRHVGVGALKNADAQALSKRFPRFNRR